MSTSASGLAADAKPAVIAVGAVVGAAGGGILGGLMGLLFGHAGVGALLGAAAGGLAGGITGDIEANKLAAAASNVTLPPGSTQAPATPTPSPT